MLGVFADDPDDTLAFDDLTFVADGLDRSSDFHVSVPFLNRCLQRILMPGPRSGGPGRESNQRQNLSTLLGNRYRMFEVAGELSV